MDTAGFDSLLIIGSNNFLAPYIERHFVEAGIVEAKRVIYDVIPDDFSGNILVVACDVNKMNINTLRGVVRAIGFSNTSFYDVTEGENFNEETPLIDCEMYGMEIRFETFFRNVPHTIIRLPELVIGTGMTNMAMDMVRQIYRGTYMHIDGADGRCSAVHATSVAEVAALCALKDVTGTFIFTDGVNHSVKDIAEALAHRLDDRKIFSVSDKKARFLRFFGNLLGIGGWSGKMYDFKHRKLTFSPAILLSKLDYQPVSVTEYLLNHVYDENSL
ncbi:MAG: hypothetical protein ACI30S_08555 [Muribaculaceae bacterium]